MIHMEISSLNPQAIRIKGKSAAFVANPLNVKAKTQADAVILLSRGDPDLSKIEEYRLVIVGAGEYEVSGAKISTIGSSGFLCHFITIDNSEVCITSNSFLAKKTKDLQRECPIVVLYCDADVDIALITELSPQSLMLFGEKAMDVAKSLGKDSAKSGKVQISSDKLPEEMQVTILA